MDATRITDVLDVQDFDTPSSGVPDAQTFTFASGGGGTGVWNLWSRRGSDMDGTVTPTPVEFAGGLVLNRIRKNNVGDRAQILMNRASGPAFSAWRDAYPAFKFTITTPHGTFELNRENADSIGSGFARWNLDLEDSTNMHAVAENEAVTMRVEYE